MKILVVTPYYKPAWVYGGPARSIPTLCEGLAKVGCQVTVLTTNAGGPRPLAVPLSQPVAIDGVEVWYFPLGWPARYFQSAPLERACFRFAPGRQLAVIECLWQHTAPAAAAACRDAGIPYIVPLRGQLLPLSLSRSHWKKRLFLALYGKRYLNGAAGLHCTDDSEVEAAKRLNLRAPAFVIPNAVDMSRFDRLPPPGSLRRKFGIPDGERVLLFMGRLHRQKRPDIAVEALAAAQTLAGGARLVIAGADQDHLSDGLRRQAAMRGCERRLHFAGMLNGADILGALADADVLLMPSETPENFGMSAVEGLAAGVPVLTTEAVPVGRWASRAGAAKLAPCSPTLFAQSACQLLSDEAARRELGAAGRRYARAHFDQLSVARLMLDHYRTVLKSGAPDLGGEAYV